MAKGQRKAKTKSNLRLHGGHHSFF